MLRVGIDVVAWSGAGMCGWPARARSRGSDAWWTPEPGFSDFERDHDAYSPPQRPNRPHHPHHVSPRRPGKRRQCSANMSNAGLLSQWSRRRSFVRVSTLPGPYGCTSTLSLYFSSTHYWLTHTTSATRIGSRAKNGLSCIPLVSARRTLSASLPLDGAPVPGH